MKAQDVDEQSGLQFTWSESKKSCYKKDSCAIIRPLDYSLCESDIKDLV